MSKGMTRFIRSRMRAETCLKSRLELRVRPASRSVSATRRASTAAALGLLIRVMS